MTISSTQFALPTAGFSITARIKLRNIPGAFAQVVMALAEQGASLAEVAIFECDFHHILRDITFLCRSEEHSQQVLNIIRGLPNTELVHFQDDTFAIHEGGKIEVVSKGELRNYNDLSRAYTPGVARVCLAIFEDERKSFDYTIRKNTVAVVTDGTAVLGLGDIGPRAALPVMEGKALLFKHFANVDAFPICLDTKDPEEIIRTVKLLAPGFGGINLEDIAAPNCFEIESRLRKELDIPVFHDDQHGTAVVVLAGIFNALKITGKKLADCKIVVNGFGSGGVACTKMLLSAGAKNIIPCDKAGIVYRGRTDRMNPMKEEVIQVTNPDNIKGSVADACRGADIFLGVSQPGAINRAVVQSMAKDPIIFALANPIPEILPEEIKDIARVIATGRSDYANQINNVLCFPGIFRGALDCRASDITDGMKIAAAEAIASEVAEADLHEQRIIPSVFDGDVASKVAKAVQAAARKDGVARI